jgi:hypothetical protein
MSGEKGFVKGKWAMGLGSLQALPIPLPLTHHLHHNLPSDPRQRGHHIEKTADVKIISKEVKEKMDLGPR